MEKTTINVAELAKEVAAESGMTQKTVKEVFAALDTVVKANLARPDSLENTPRAIPFFIAIMIVEPAKPPTAA